MPALNTLTLYQAKELATSFRPTVLVAIALPLGPTIYVCSATNEGFDGIIWPGDGNTYMPRLSQQQAEQLQAMSPQGLDVTGQYTLQLADADYFFSGLESTYGFASAIMTCTLVMYDPLMDEFSTDSSVRFFGSCNGGTRKGSIFTVNAVGSFDLRMKTLPDRQVQSTCTHIFPTTAAARADGLAHYVSNYYACGYSPDQPSGVGNFKSGTTPFTSCPKGKADCIARGMYSTDHNGTTTSRFGGEQWLPPDTWKGKAYVSGNQTTGINSANPQKYADFYNESYGHSWLTGIWLNVLGDPNSTRGEIAVANGTLNRSPSDIKGTGIISVVVNGILVPWDDQTDDLLFRVYVIADGSRNGTINATEIYNGNGDPHGSTAVIMPVVYQQIQASNAPGNCQILVGPRILPVFSSQTIFTLLRTDSPAWCLLEVYRRAGIPASAFDMASVMAVAADDARSVSYTNQFGASASHRAYGVALGLDRPQSSATISDGLRTANRIMVVPNASGTLLRMVRKSTLNQQQPAPVAGSNDSTAYTSYKVTDDPTLSPTGTGYVAYFFDESTIMGTPEMLQAKVSESPNVLVASIQDEDNLWTQDTVTLTDDVALNRAEHRVQSTFSAIGLPNYEQAYRALQTKQFELYRGNPRGDSGGTWRFRIQTTVRAVHLNAGMIVSLSLQGWGLTKQLFRVMGNTPSSDFESATLELQWHDDRAYTDKYGQAASPYFTTGGGLRISGPPKSWAMPFTGNVAADPVYGNSLGAANFTEIFGLSVGIEQQPDGAISPELIMSTMLPRNKLKRSLAPQLELQGTTATTGGHLPDGKTWYAYVTSVDSSGNEGPVGRLPCLIYAPGGSNTNTVTVPVLGWPAGTATWNVYMGTNSSQTALVASGSGTPSSITVPNYVARALGPPDSNFDHFVVYAKRLSSVGWLLIGPGLGQASVGANTVTSTVITFGFCYNWATGQQFIPADGSLNGYIIMAVYQSGGGEIPFVNLKIASNVGMACTIDMSVGTVDLTTLNLDAMWFSVMHQIASLSGSIVTLLNLSLGTDTTAGVGSLVRILAGAGAGQPVRTIVAGDLTGGTFTMDSPFTAGVDATSVIIFEEPGWRITQRGASVANGHTAAAATTLKANFQNGTGAAWLVMGASSDKNGNEAPELWNPLRIFFWPGQTAQGIVQGANLIPNASLAIPGGPGEVAGGWIAVQNDRNAYVMAADATEVIYGANSFHFHFNGNNQTLGAAGSGTDIIAAVVETNVPYPIPASGESYFCKILAMCVPSTSLTAGLQIVFALRMVILYSDATLDQDAAGGNFTTYSVWETSTNTIQVNPAKRPVQLYTTVAAYVQNLTGSPVSVPTSPFTFDVYCGGMSMIRVIDIGTEATANSSSWLNPQGGIVPAQTIPITISGLANDGSDHCSATASWSATALVRGDGSSLSVPAGSFTWSLTLAVSEYYLYLRIDAGTGVMHLASGDPPTTPPTAPSRAYSIAQITDKWYPQPLVTFTTPASGGTGAGHGGGEGPCPDYRELVFERDRGVIQLGEVKAGDWLRGKDWKTGEAKYSRVKEISLHPSNTWRIVAGKRVSALHPVSDPEKLRWQLPYRIGTFDRTPGMRVRILLDSPEDDYDAANYSLVDEAGAECLISHNYFVSPS